MIKRTIQFIPVWLGLSVLVFAMVHMIPGDPAIAMLGGQPVTAENIARVHKAMGLDEPIHVQYGRFLAGIAKGNFGNSLRSGQPVFTEIFSRFPATMELTTTALGLAIFFGVISGIICAVFHRKAADQSLLVLSILGISIPGFWLGMILIAVFSVYLGWLPVAGRGSLAHLIMPAFTLGIGPAAMLMRLTRTSMLEVLGNDYIRTARAKGLKENRVVFYHALKNALNPIVTVFGLQFATLLGGAFIIEQVFARPGVGRLAVQAIYTRDIPMIQGVVLVSGTIFLLINLVVDLLYAFVDPRVRYQ